MRLSSLAYFAYLVSKTPYALTLSATGKQVPDSMEQPIANTRLGFDCAWAEGMTSGSLSFAQSAIRQAAMTVSKTFVVRMLDMSFPEVGGQP